MMKMDYSFLNVLLCSCCYWYCCWDKEDMFFNLMNMAKKEILIYVLLLFGSFVPIMFCDGGVVVAHCSFVFVFPNLFLDMRNVTENSNEH